MRSDEKQVLDASRSVGSFAAGGMQADVAECIRKRWVSMGWLNPDGTLTAKAMGRGYVPQVEVPLPTAKPIAKSSKRRRSKKEVAAVMFPAMEEPIAEPDTVEVAPPIVSGEPEEIAPPIVPTDGDSDVIIEDVTEARD